MSNQKGQTAIEYALIAIVILVIITTAIKDPLNAALNAAFSKIQNSVTEV